MTPDAAGIEAALAAGLAAHRLNYGTQLVTEEEGLWYAYCSCPGEWTFTGPSVDLAAAHDAHVPGLGELKRGRNGQFAEFALLGLLHGHGEIGAVAGQDMVVKSLLDCFFDEMEHELSTIAWRPIHSPQTSST